jgi:ElaB/YqjD/DUF883 family membrane-anchored ribosome-binding protein
MNSATVESPTPESPTSVRDRVLDAARHAAHVSHEAKLLKSIATDAVEDGIHAAKRAFRNVKRSVERVEDFKDEAAHSIKRQPLKSIAIAAGVGLAVGALVGWYARVGRSGRAGESTREDET